MKFTKGQMLMVSVLVGVAIIGAKLSLKTMEGQAPQPRMIRYPLVHGNHMHIPYLEALSATRLESLTLRELIEKTDDKGAIVGWVWQTIIKKLTSASLLNEFRDNGTIEGVSIKELISNNLWFLNYLKPATANLVYPYDGNVQILSGHTSPISSAAFSPDGTKIVTASYDTTARVWMQNTRGNWTSSLPLTGHTRVVKSAAFSPDGTKIVTASWDRTARIWTQDAQGKRRRPLSKKLNPALSGNRAKPTGVKVDWTSSLPLRGHTSPLSSAAFSPDGTNIVTASSDMTARVWTQDAEENWISSLPLTEHNGSVLSAAFSPNGTNIVTASGDNTARVWTQDTQGNWISSLPLTGHTDMVSSAAFSPDGTKIVTASYDSTARVWTQDTEGNWISSLPLTGHTQRIFSAAFSPDGTKIVTISADETARVWTQDTEGNWTSSLPLTGHTGLIGSAAFSPNGTNIVTASMDGTAHVWTQDTKGNWISSLPLTGHTDFVHSVAFSTDGTNIVAISDDNTARVWTQIDLVGDDNVAEKIILLQLLARDGSDILNNKPHLQKILSTFDQQAKDYLIKKYDIPPTLWDQATTV